MFFRPSLIVAAVPALAVTAALAHPPDQHEPPADQAGVSYAPARSVPVPTIVGSGPYRYEVVVGWGAPPDDRPFGNTHGGVVMDAGGRIYFNTDTKRSVMIYESDGRFVGSILGDHPGIHGMVLRNEGGREFIYAAHLQGKKVLKATLDGEVLWTLGVPKASGKYDDDPNAYNPTSIAVGPDGDIYVADGYGRNWIHQFDADRNYIRSFGGRGQEPGSFRTCHGIAIDDRGETPCLLVCDRENRRLQRFTLEGEHIDVPISGLRRPCSISIEGDLVAVAELEGRATILDRDFEVIAHVGDNPDRTQWASNGVPREKWVDGIFTAPHGCCFAPNHDLYVCDWNATGRITKLTRVETAGE